MLFGKVHATCQAFSILSHSTIQISHIAYYYRQQNYIYVQYFYQILCSAFNNIVERGTKFRLNFQRNLFHITFFFSVALRPNAGHGLLVLEVSRSHTTTHHSRYNSSGRVISSTQRPLPDNTQHSQTDKHPCPRWDLNPRSQQANGRRPTP